MATLRRAVSCFLQQRTSRNLTRVSALQLVRHRTTTETGAILSRPSTVRLGLPKVLVILVPLVYLGATISKEGAAFLEENDIFVPDDDDD